MVHSVGLSKLPSTANQSNGRAKESSPPFGKRKTDQERRGREIAMSRSNGTMCPVTALQCWIEASGIVEGPLFRPIDRAGTVAPGALSGEAVGIILKRRLKQNGWNPEKYSGQSLRAGFVSEAVNAGTPTWKIRRQRARERCNARQLHSPSDGIFRAVAN
jgi:hypothetical protein